MTVNKPGVLFSFEVWHTYFTKDICRCFTFKPGPVTAALQRKYGFIMQQNNYGNGFTFYSGSAGDTVGLLNYITTSTGYTQFDFVIESTDAAFYTYTSLPANWHGLLEFNSDAATAVPATGQILLRTQFSAAANVRAAGSVLIYFSDIINACNDKNTPAYIARLQAKATQWQYFFINNSALPLNDPLVQGSNGTAFEGPETVTIATGQKALFFNSGKQLLPLTEKLVQQFSLVNRGSRLNDTVKSPARIKTIIKWLPCPVPSQFDIVQVDGVTQFSSPMYIFI
ncbi:hypothetical protein [Ferruginibacter profundus]